MTNVTPQHQGWTELWRIHPCLSRTANSPPTCLSRPTHTGVLSDLSWVGGCVLKFHLIQAFGQALETWRIDPLCEGTLTLTVIDRKLFDLPTRGSHPVR